MTTKVLAFKYSLLLATILVGALGVYFALQIENTILNSIFILAIVITAVYTGIHVNNAFKNGK